MQSATLEHQKLLEWGVASLPLAGETVSGDMHAIRPFEHGALVAVVDGLGHGAEATEAAQAAVTELSRNPQFPVIALVNRCHTILARTRGVVMTLASLNALDSTVTCLGVGNVEALLLRADTSASHSRETVLLRNGIVGHLLPALVASVLTVSAGDLLIFATDGIRPSFADDLDQALSPQQLADQIMAGHFKGTDDALVLVVRYRGRCREQVSAQGAPGRSRCGGVPIGCRQ